MTNGFEERLLADLKAHVTRRAGDVPDARPVGPRVRLSRGWRLAGAFGLAVALAAGGLAIQAIGLGDQRPPAASASEILRLAAEAARQQPELTARPDQYVFTEFLATTRERPDSGPYLTVRTQLWQSAGGLAHPRVRHRPENDPDGWSDLKVIRPDDPTNPERKLDEFPSPAYHGDLPDDPDALLRYLREHPVDLHLPDGAGGDAGSMVYVTARSMLDGYVPPKALAALFELLAREPGAVVMPDDVVDAAGRRGVAIRMPGVIGGSHDFIFDRETYVYLGTRSAVVRGGVESMDSASALVRLAIVDEPGQVP